MQHNDMNLRMLRYLLQLLLHLALIYVRMTSINNANELNISILDGIRIASANTIEMLMEHDFDMVVNDKVYRVLTPPQEKASKVCV